jgi:hypothetical protein
MARRRCSRMRGEIEPLLRRGSGPTGEEGRTSTSAFLEAQMQCSTETRSIRINRLTDEVAGSVSRAGVSTYTPSPAGSPTDRRTARRASRIDGGGSGGFDPSCWTAGAAV